MQRILRGPFVWILVLLIALWATVSLVNHAAAPKQLTYSQWVEAVEDDRVQNVKNLDQSRLLTGELKDERSGQTVPYRVAYSPEVNGEQIGRLVADNRIPKYEVDPEQGSPLLSFLFQMLPFVFVFVLFFLFMQQMQGGGNRVMSFGKARAKMVSKDQPKVTFADVAVSSYGSATRTSGTVRILKDLDVDIQGRHVLLVEDVVDSGLTLNYLLRNLRSRKPASLEVLALLTKPSQQRIDIPIRYHGFAVPDVFVVGYGLDYGERYRNLPFIATLTQDPSAPVTQAAKR